jgi:hypothetical protein
MGPQMRPVRRTMHDVGERGGLQEPRSRNQGPLGPEQPAVVHCSREPRVRMAQPRRQPIAPDRPCHGGVSWDRHQRPHGPMRRGRGRMSDRASWRSSAITVLWAEERVGEDSWGWAINVGRDESPVVQGNASKPAAAATAAAAAQPPKPAADQACQSRRSPDDDARLAGRGHPAEVRVRWSRVFIPRRSTEREVLVSTATAAPLAGSTATMLK